MNQELINIAIKKGVFDGLISYIEKVSKLEIAN
jgi:hypothetical protein